MSSKTLSRKIDKAIFRFKLIEPGDKILLAVSGGKDSLAMSYFMGHKQEGFPIPFELGAVHIEGDFPGCGKSPVMAQLMEEWGVPFETVKVPIMARLKPGKSMNCYWCSTQRRMELMRYAGENGYNKIALGHHMDDILETFFMNMMHKSELSTMLPKLKYDKYPFTVIRPLAYVKEQEIIDFSIKKDLLKAAAVCQFGTTSTRLDARRVIEAIAAEEGSSVKDNIFEAMCNPVHRYMPYTLLDNEEDSES
ncbi:ATP-binding protein [Oceanispirochaeta sp.]|jgi:tRNA 2-thiocytidine biosynthesis protein TtcA|uniref:tRNA 2-thiocytidine biosynthesis TtcA family protein n=1 Tax=Oceanispirochaeta sp. TaxID=2035350 RepID=UPI002618BFF6|nr:ATP-binding protein [Oceanispirochaeta sp.]MDA3958814.1 tRNA 2-thiocytidine biosynthesis protein TtcA [Oceanispirochaeta sp.]